MSNRENIVAEAMDLIYFRESSRGKNRGKDATGAAYTKGNYHITTKRAAEDSQTYRELYSHMDERQFADFMYDNPGIEEMIAEEIVNSTLDKATYLDLLPTREAAAITRSLYNMGGQPNLRRAARAYATAIETGVGDLELYKMATIQQMDATKAKGQFEYGVMNETHQLREYAMGDKPIDAYDLGLSPEKSSALNNKAKEIRDTSATGRAVLQNLGVPFGKGTDKEFQSWQDLHHHKAYERDFGGEAQKLVRENRPGLMETVGAASFGLPTIVAGVGYIASKFGAFDEDLGTITPPTPRPEGE